MTVSSGDDPPGAGTHDAVSLAAGGVRYCVRRFGTRVPGPADSGADSEDDGTAGADDPGAPAAPRPAGRAGQAVPALLLHDVAGGLGDWDVLAGELAADRTAIAVAPKGLGDSEDRDPYTGDALAAELAALVLHAVDGRVDVVGHGTGAILAWNLAARRPDLVRRVVLISGARALAPGAVVSLVLRAARVPGQAITTDPGQAMRRGRICAEYARLEPIGRISSQRVMVVWGARDQVSPLTKAQRIADSLTRTLPPETVRMVTLPGVGHRPLAESAQRCAALVASFLRAP